LRSYGGLKSQNVKNVEQFLRYFEKTTPYGKIFNILFRKFFIATPIDVLCSIIVKFGRRKIGEIVRYLPDKKKQNFAWLFSCRY